MEVRFESDLKEKEKLISECLKLEIKLKRLEKRWRVKKKRNLMMKQHNKLLNEELLLFGKQSFENVDYQKVFEVKECRVFPENLKKNQVNKLITNQLSSSTKRFQCQHPGCKSSFKLKINFLQHQHVHTTKYQCQFCQKCFANSSALQNHIYFHTGERNFICKWIDCGKKFKTKIVLQRHIIYKHTDKRPFQCQENGCGKRFKTKALLNEHLKCHSSLRPFQCQVKGCKKRFKVKPNLREHVNYVHSDVRNFRCDFENCQKAFKNQHDLNHHRRTHR